MAEEGNAYSLGMPDVEETIKEAVSAMFKKYAKDSKWKKQDYAVN